MHLRFTLFDTKFSEVGRNFECASQDDILTLLKPRKAESKDQLPILRLIEDTHRSSARFTGLIIDLDGKRQPHTLEDIQNAFRDIDFIAYETFNSSPNQKRWRVVFPVKTSFDMQTKRKALQALNELTELDIDPTSIRNLEIGQYAPGNTNGDVTLHLSLNQSHDILSWPSLISYMATLAELDEKRPGLKDHQLQLDSLWSGVPLEISDYNQVKELWLDPAVQLHIAHEVFGLSPRLFNDFSMSHNCSSKTFRSPIFGHLDKHPSCTLLYDPGRCLLVKDHSEFVPGRSLWSFDDLAYYEHRVRSCPALEQEPFELTGPERYVWRLRLLIQAGVVKKPSIEFESLPDGFVGSSAETLWHSIIDLFRTRWAVTSEIGRPAPLGIKFLSFWSGLSEFRVRKARNELMRLGYISIVDEQRVGAKRLQLCMPGKYRTSSDKRSLHLTTIERLSLTKARINHRCSREEAISEAVRQNDVPNTHYGDWHFKWLLEQYLGCAGNVLEEGSVTEVIADFESILGVVLRRRESRWMRAVLLSCSHRLEAG